MKKRNLPPKENKERIKHERDPIPWRYCLLTLVCGLLLVVGFFWAARQHFSAMDFGIKNAKLRQQKESLEADQRRLYLTKEISLSPGEIKKVAKKFGLQDLTADSIAIISPSKDVEKIQNGKTLNENNKKAVANKAKDENTEKLKKSEDSKPEGKAKESAKNKAQTTVTTARPQIAKK